MEDSTIPYIVEIKRNSLDDGPGIRTVIFFKGCPLSCVWCQNPETKSPNQELLFEREKCTECMDCVDSCKYDALDFNNNYPVNLNLCQYCGDCIRACEANALQFAGRQYSIEDLMDIILKDKVFYRNSGGGVTFSGGEPTLYMTYLHKLLKQLNKEEIHTCLETCGYYNPSEFNKLILPYIDLIYFDLKLYNQEYHNRYCKTSNSKILNNFEELINKKNVEVLPRIPLIPDITAPKDNLREWVKYLKSHHIQKIALLPYNPLWISKTETIGKVLEYNHSKWLSDKDKKEIKEIFKNFDYRDF